MSTHAGNRESPEARDLRAVPVATSAPAMPRAAGPCLRMLGSCLQPHVLRVVSVAVRLADRSHLNLRAEEAELQSGQGMLREPMLSMMTTPAR